jgi:mono/diheme cytochrome c family protein
MKPAHLFVGLVSCAVLAACKVDARRDYLGDRAPQRLMIGTPVTPQEVAAADIDVLPNGAGLPPGRGTAAEGAKVYAASCASCHGPNGEGQGTYPALIGGPRGTFDFASDPKMVRTIGNYWPYATTVFDYVRRAMPLTAPGSLTADQTYAVTAYLLARNGLIDSSAVVDASSLPKVIMPARDHFVLDDRHASMGGKSVR